jgi:DNA-binding PadR family transcriptional regulator
MVDRSSASTLGFALLGLISQKPRSGYDLRKFFSSTPMASFSDSPGTIYPALRRLERGGLIRGQIDRERGRRQRKLFRLTPRGRVEFHRWQQCAITRADVEHGVDALILRFAFMDEGAGRTAAFRFLKALGKELAEYVSSLREYRDCNRPLMTISGRLALESGILRYETLLRWAKAAMTAYRKGK